MIPVHYCSLFSKISKLTFIITFFPPPHLPWAADELEFIMNSHCMN